MKTHHKLRTFLNLRLFDGEGTGSGAAAPNGEGSAPSAQGSQGELGGSSSLANVQYGKEPRAKADGEAQATKKDATAKKAEVSVTSDADDARRAEFERLIKGEYKDLFDERAQQIINTRFKDTKALEAQANQAKALAPVLDLLASKYGVDSTDAAALAKAIEEDDSYYEEEALAKGLTVEQLKSIKRLERENAEFKRAAQEQQRRANADRIYAQWEQQSEAMKGLYPSFDLRTECNNPETGKRFVGLLKSGVDVKTAFEVIHKDELIGGAMQYAAQAVQKKVTDDIRARGMRPAENGGSGTSAATTRKADPSTWTKKDREEVSRRVMRGERIEL